MKGKSMEYRFVLTLNTTPHFLLHPLPVSDNIYFKNKVESVKIQKQPLNYAVYCINVFDLTIFKQWKCVEVKVN